MRLAHFVFLMALATLFASTAAGQTDVASSAGATKSDTQRQKSCLRTLKTTGKVVDIEEERGLISGTKKLLEKVKTNNAAKKLRKEALAREAALKQAATKAKQAETQKMLDRMLTNRNYRFEAFNHFFKEQNIRSQDALPRIFKSTKYKDIYDDFGVYLGDKGFGNVRRVPMPF